MPLMAAFSVWINRLLGGEEPGPSTLQNILQQPVMLVPILLISIIAGALSEELGWRGFAQERMTRRWGLPAALAALAVIWGVWHLPLFFIPGTSQHGWGWGSTFFWLFLLNFIPLTVWLGLAYDRNQGSILAAVLIHFLFNFTMSLIFPFSPTLFAILSVLLYVFVAALLIWRP
jgi:uncharacterized protein